MEHPWIVAGLAALGVIVTSTVIFVGPWPARLTADIGGTRFMTRNLERIDAETKTYHLRQAADGDMLMAGWATRELVPPVGTPLAGYGDRKGEPSTGTHDPLQVGAVAFSVAPNTDELDIAAFLVTTDLLVVTENIAKGVRQALTDRIGAPAPPILFTASHTHSGPGAAMRGLVARAFGGAYDREVERTIIETIVETVLDSTREMATVEVTMTSVAVPDLIRNRTRDTTVEAALVDPFLDVIRLTGRDGRSCALVRYSAHSTVIGHESMVFSADYPGSLREAVETRYGGAALFLGGALGSMGPQAPEGTDDYDRAARMGAALDQRLDDATESIVPIDRFGVCDIEITSPPIQLRIARRLEVSPIFLAANGVNRSARMTAIALGDVVLVGFPGDVSGEIAMSLRDWGAESERTIMSTSFSGDYLGYISPDEYYTELRDGGGLAYETGIMSWTGPAQEAFFITLARRLVESVTQ